MACPATELEHTEAHSVKGLGCAVQADLQFSELPSGLALKMLTILYSEKREETLRILSVIMTLGMQHSVGNGRGSRALYRNTPTIQGCRFCTGQSDNREGRVLRGLLA